MTRLTQIGLSCFSSPSNKRYREEKKDIDNWAHRTIYTLTNVLNYEYKRAVIKAKRKYYKDIIKDLKTSKTSQWYSKLKKLCSHDQKKSEPITVESLKHLTVKEQAEAIAEKFCLLFHSAFKKVKEWQLLLLQ